MDFLSQTPSGVGNFGGQLDAGTSSINSQDSISPRKGFLYGVGTAGALYGGVFSPAQSSGISAEASKDGWDSLPSPTSKVTRVECGMEDVDMLQDLMGKVDAEAGVPTPEPDPERVPDPKRGFNRFRGNFETTIHVPDDLAGYVIGSGGKTLRGVQGRCRVCVTVPNVPDPENARVRTVSIQGHSPLSIRAAAAWIRTIYIRGQQRNQTARAPKPQPQPETAKESALSNNEVLPARQQDYELFPAKERQELKYRIKLDISSTGGGPIIGKGGERIRRIQHESKARLKVTNYGKTSELVIIGSLDAIKMAKQLVRFCLAESALTGRPKQHSKRT